MGQNCRSCLKVEFPRDWHKEVKDYCDKIGIDFSTSPYDFEAVDLCEKLKFLLLKLDLEKCLTEMIEYVAKKYAYNYGNQGCFSCRN